MQVDEKGHGVNRILPFETQRADTNSGGRFLVEGQLATSPLVRELGSTVSSPARVEVETRQLNDYSAL